jgi:hypothetical protein
MTDLTITQEARRIAGSLLQGNMSDDMLVWFAQCPELSDAFRDAMTRHLFFTDSSQFQLDFDRTTV